MSDLSVNKCLSNTTICLLKNGVLNKLVRKLVPLTNQQITNQSLLFSKFSYIIYFHIILVNSCDSLSKKDCTPSFTTENEIIDVKYEKYGGLKCRLKK